MKISTQCLSSCRLGYMIGGRAAELIKNSV
jgi:hypothetical protein